MICSNNWTRPNDFRLPVVIIRSLAQRLIDLANEAVSFVSFANSNSCRSRNTLVPLPIRMAKFWQVWSPMQEKNRQVLVQREVVSKKRRRPFSSRGQVEEDKCVVQRGKGSGSSLLRLHNHMNSLLHSDPTISRFSMPPISLCYRDNPVRFTASHSKSDPPAVSSS
jgi:hypothetical protein